MRVEMEVLEKNGRWEIVELLRGKKPIGSKWVFTVKYKTYSSLERYRVRLVEKGFTQTYGFDYQETFAPVAKMNAIRILFSLDVIFDWGLQHFDVKNVFLHGDLEEEIYMEVTLGFNMGLGKNKVYKLKSFIWCKAIS